MSISIVNSARGAFARVWGPATYTYKEFAQALGQTVAVVEAAARAAVYGQGIALDQLINRNRMVPVKTGALRDSHYVTLPEMRMGQWTVELGYGAPYAAEIHERGANRGENAAKGWRGHHMNGTPEWLRRAAYVWGRTYLARMQRSIAALIRTGTGVEALAGIVPTTPSYQPRGLRGKARRKAIMASVYTREQQKRMNEARKGGQLALIKRRRKNEEVSYLEKRRKEAYLAGDRKSFSVAQAALMAYRAPRGLNRRSTNREEKVARERRRAEVQEIITAVGYNLPVNTRRGKK